MKPDAPLTLNPSVLAKAVSNRDSQPLLEIILNALPQKIFWKDLDLRFAGCNQPFCDDAGFSSPQEILGLSDFDMPWTDSESQYFRSCDQNIIESDTPKIGIVESKTSINGNVSWVETSKVPLHDENGKVIGLLGMYRDVTHWKKSEHALQQSHQELGTRFVERTRELQYLSRHDGLTHLLNREHFLRDFDIVLTQDNAKFAILFIDLDRFKSINDSLGHATGDQILIQVSRILRESIGSGDIIGRFSGDEFTVLVRNATDQKKVVALVNQIQSALQTSIRIAQSSLILSASIGIVLASSDDYQVAEHVLRDADIAMYEAKCNGKARHRFFDEQMYAFARTRLTLENEMRSGLLNDKFYLQYQPILDISGRRLTGFEALVRWRHPQRGNLAPDEFISLAEESGLISQLGEVVLCKACAQLSAWRIAFPNDAARLTVNVNLSAAQLESPGFQTRLSEIISDHGLNPSDINIEITENLLLKNNDATLELLQGLRAQGHRLLLDDFGTGFCSLSYLHRYPIDTLKIDKSFVALMGSDPQSKAIVNTMMALARTLNLDVVAEGVETRWQEQVICEMGCEYAQGFLYAQPLSPDDAAVAITNPQSQWRSGRKPQRRQVDQMKNFPRSAEPASSNAESTE